MLKNGRTACSSFRVSNELERTTHRGTLNSPFWPQQLIFLAVRAMDKRPSYSLVNRMLKRLSTLPKLFGATLANDVRICTCNKKLRSSASRSSTGSRLAHPAHRVSKKGQPGCRMTERRNFPLGSTKMCIPYTVSALCQCNSVLALQLCCVGRAEGRVYGVASRDLVHCLSIACRDSSSERHLSPFGVIFALPEMVLGQPRSGRTKARGSKVVFNREISCYTFPKKFAQKI